MEGLGTDGASVVEGSKTRSTLLLNKTCRYVQANTASAFPWIIDGCYLARIVANQPLRAKEASPFISNKYPVIVGLLQIPLPSSRIDSNDGHDRTTSTMPSLSALVEQVFEPLSVWPRLGSIPHA